MLQYLKELLETEEKCFATHYECCKGGTLNKTDNVFLFIDANINSRDNSGRKPRQLARDTLTIEAQSMVTLTISYCTIIIHNPTYRYFD